MCITLETTFSCHHTRFTFHGCPSFDNGEDRPFFNPPDSEMCPNSRDEMARSTRLYPACEAEARRREAVRRAERREKGGRCEVM
jgi:hypothetical protein